MSLRLPVIRQSSEDRARCEAKVRVEKVTRWETAHLEEEQAAEKELVLWIAGREKELAAQRKTFEGQLAEAEKAARTEEAELSQLQAALEKQLATVGEAEEAAGHSLAGASVDDLMAEAGAVAAAQSKLAAVKAVEAELRRRCQVQKTRVKAAGTVVRAARADLLDAEMCAVELAIAADVRRLSGAVAELLRLEGAFDEVCRLTRQGVLPVSRLKDLAENYQTNLAERDRTYGLAGFFGRQIRNHNDG